MEGVCQMGAGIFYVLFNAMASLLAGCKRVCETGDAKKIFYAFLLVFGLITVASQPLHADYLDTWNWRNPLPQGNQLNSVTYSNSTFVAVEYYGTILTSADGVTWTISTSGTNISLLGVTYGKTPEADEQEVEKLKKVTVQDVERLARKVFQNDNHLIVIAE